MTYQIDRFLFFAITMKKAMRILLILSWVVFYRIFVLLYFIRIQYFYINMIYRELLSSSTWEEIWRILVSLDLSIPVNFNINFILIYFGRLKAKITLLEIFGVFDVTYYYSLEEVIYFRIYVAFVFQSESRISF